jgi:hypothetical protein
MRRAAVFLISLTLHATTYYVASSGSDSNPGTQTSPWLTVQNAVNHMACGDTLMVVANGSYVAGDANLPYFPNCGQTTTIQSSALAQFAPPGYRTNPVKDSANYGKLSFAFQGIWAQATFYNWNAYYMYSGVSINTSTSQLTVVTGNGLALAGLSNGTQVEFEPQSEGSSNGNGVWPTINPPGSLSLLTKYYVVGCSASCGAVNSTFFLSDTLGGSPLPISSCGAFCINTVSTDQTAGTPCTWGQSQYNPLTNTLWYCPGTSVVWSTFGPNNGGSVLLELGVVVGVDMSTSTFTIPHNWGSGTLSNGLPVAFSAGGLQVIGTLPSPLQLDQVYYTVGVSGNQFQVATAPSGTPITITSPGTGMLTVANTNVPNNWAFRGLETAVNDPHFPGIFFEFGSNNATSQYGMVHHMEIDRCYSHDTPGANGISRNVFENGSFISIHDSWISSGYSNEGQAILGTVGVGPTTITNNFLEAGGEITLYGGDWPAYPGPNARKVFQGNYYYKPPLWKQSQGSGPASGPCLYDATDPTHVGGEWYRDTAAGQNYQCNSSGVWAPTSAPLPTSLTLKNMAEHKNGRFFSYIGNLFNGSYAQAQSGEIWNNSMEYGSGPGMANDHITIINNAAFNSLQMMTRQSQCGLTSSAVCPINPGNHLTNNNLMVINALACGTSFNRALCGYGGTQSNTGGTAPYFNGDSWDHNTIWIADGFPFANVTPMYANSPNGTCPPFPTVPTNLFSYTNNIAPGDFLAQCESPGGASLSPYYSNSTFLNNALAGAVGSYANVGASNLWRGGVFPTNNAAVGYVNGTGTMSGDYHLASTSNFSASSPFFTQLSADLTDLGADIDLINMATSGAAAGTPPWDQQAGLQIDPGSSQAVFRYTAPTADACTATIYGAAARVPANLVVSVADSSANSISNANAREIPITGLQASTHYWYKLACGNGVLMVGNFVTRAAGRQAARFSFDWSTPTPVSYSSSRNMSGAVSLAAATRQFVPVGINSLVYVKLGATGPITMLIAP